MGAPKRIGIAVAGALALAALLPVAQAGAQDAQAAADGLRFGIAAGEVRAHSARIWTRAGGAGRVRAAVATDRRFRNVVARTTRRARPGRDFTVQAVIRGLRANQVHHYRWCARRFARLAGGRASVACERGQFRTAPRPDRTRAITFALTGDTDGTRLADADEPFFGTFEVFRSMRLENNDFNVHMGDTIYSDTGVGDPPPALSVPAKWRKYRENLQEENLRRIRASAGFYSHWDDHEFINDFSIPEFGRPLYRRGVKAFRNYAPVTYSRQDGIYRMFRWGRNLQLFFLDQRSFRDAKASAGGICDNPDTGSPDLAPTAPQETRNLFSALIPSLAQPVSEVCKHRINTPDRTLLGTRQFGRFMRDLRRSDARWKIVMNETPMQQFYGLPYDRWEGYAFERMRLLNQLEARGVDNVVFLTTDTHAAFANVVRKRTLEDDVAPRNAPPGTPPIDTDYDDFIIGPVATNTFWAEIDSVTGREGDGQLLSNAFFKPDPPNGVGMLCAQGDQYSYAQVTVTRRAVTVAYKDENGDTVLDVNDEPCGPYTLPR
jgi:alkaline phosphatase D